MNRRGFMRSMLALGMAPAVISSGVLMPVKTLLLPNQDFQIGMYEGFSYIETATPVNFILMKHLLEAARKKLPYFKGTTIGEDYGFTNDGRVSFEVRMS